MAPEVRAFTFVLTVATVGVQAEGAHTVSAHRLRRHPYDATVCVAATPQELVGCANAVQSGRSSVIEVRGALVCSGADACRVKIQGPSVWIRGIAGAAIRRVDHHDYPLIQVIGGASAAITDLTIDEDADVTCSPVSPTNPPVENAACGRSIDVYGVGDVELRNVTVAASKSIGAFLNTCGSARVSHVRFIAPLQFGLEITGLTGSLAIEDTLFWHAASNALVIYDAHGTAQAPLVVRRCLFEHNHRDDVYYVCGPQANAQCTGGQLLLSGKVDFLRVENTILRNGSDDVDPNTPVGGVELNFPSVRDITFAGDDVHAHGMWGVYVNSNPVDVARVSFVADKLYENGKDPDYLGVDIGNFPAGVMTETGTCHSAGCARVPFGALWALPSGSVSWATNDLTAPQVTVNGSLVSTAPDGQTMAAPGAAVVLYDGTTEVDTLIVPW